MHLPLKSREEQKAKLEEKPLMAAITREHYHQRIRRPQHISHTNAMKGNSPCNINIQEGPQEASFEDLHMHFFRVPQG